MGLSLQEDSRSQELTKSRGADLYAPNNRALGKNRVQRRLHSKILPSVKEFNSINMNKFFKEDILDVSVRVQGETNQYLVRVSFGGVLDKLHPMVRGKEDQKLDTRVVTRALIAAFNSGDMYTRCNCPDAQYRQNYWMSQNGTIAGEPETRPSDITNPYDTKGNGCKHVQRVLASNTWLLKVAAVIVNYSNYMKDHYERLYAEIIYPAIYDKEYEDPYQLDFDDTDELNTSEEDIDASNEYARTKNQFKKGNKQGIRFAPNPDENQMSFDDLDNEENEEE